jgi:hypothetical protein
MCKHICLKLIHDKLKKIKTDIKLVQKNVGFCISKISMPWNW